MNLFERRWLIAFLLALGAHAALFLYGGLWYTAGDKMDPPQVAEGDQALAVSLVEEPAGPAMEPAPLPAPPKPVAEERVEEPPAVKPPEPVKEPEPAVRPEARPVLTEPEPAAPAVQPAKQPEPEPAVKAAPPAAPVAREAAAAPAPVKTGAPAASSGGASGSGLASAPGGARAPGMPGGPAPLSTIHPRYPMGSRIRGEEGLVTVRARVDARGRPVEVKVIASSRYFALDAAAEKAVKGARFVPPAPGAPPESFVADLTIRFQLREP
jgi:protein TonB